jgi:hypothetical protein
VKLAITTERVRNEFHSLGAIVFFSKASSAASFVRSRESVQMDEKPAAFTSYGHMTDSRV